MDTPHGNPRKTINAVLAGTASGKAEIEKIESKARAQQKYATELTRLAADTELGLTGQEKLALQQGASSLRNEARNNLAVAAHIRDHVYPNGETGPTPPQVTP